MNYSTTGAKSMHELPVGCVTRVKSMHELPVGCVSGVAKCDKSNNFIEVPVTN
jgi:hypothetical protein